MTSSLQFPCTKIAAIHASHRMGKAPSLPELCIFAFGLTQPQTINHTQTMSMYQTYLQEIEDRKGQGLHPKPIDDAALLSEIIDQIKDATHPERDASLNFFIYNVLPGTTSAAGVKAAFLKDIILGQVDVPEVDRASALEQLSHMKGGPSIEVLLDLALGSDSGIAEEAAAVLKTQVFLYEADTNRLAEAYKAGNAIASDIITSYANAEFFTQLPEVEETIDVVTYVAGIGDISTDLLSPGSDAHLVQTVNFTASRCSNTTPCDKTSSSSCRSSTPTSV